MNILTFPNIPVSFCPAQRLFKPHFSILLHSNRQISTKYNYTTFCLFQQYPAKFRIAAVKNTQQHRPEPARMTRTPAKVQPACFKRKRISVPPRFGQGTSVPVLKGAKSGNGDIKLFVVIISQNNETKNGKIAKIRPVIPTGFQHLPCSISVYPMLSVRKAPDAAFILEITSGLLSIPAAKPVNLLRAYIIANGP